MSKFVKTANMLLQTEIAQMGKLTKNHFLSNVVSTMETYAIAVQKGTWRCSYTEKDRQTNTEIGKR